MWTTLYGRQHTQAHAVFSVITKTGRYFWTFLSLGAPLIYLKEEHEGLDEGLKVVDVVEARLDGHLLEHDHPEHGEDEHHELQRVGVMSILGNTGLKVFLWSKVLHVLF